ncbi:MAG: FtsH protease activity modulator HflK [Paracoccus sp. (in: a-proteobacteria)]|uniref:FtsH protease activity modulator HflK n=1 Tax=Paracoccus sp. TaxID=267 RepID=UPI0026DEFA65|nr:FtsH protease activity modulator HflK [Paracoccus sp. (in: a-proteobacteria)]MDO5622323.1 FtsH protease activity modulator HflK [Paracoccus sp. (in: a-proteobacteria)]
MANQGPWGGSGGNDDKGKDQQGGNRPWGQQPGGDDRSRPQGPRGEQMPEIEDLMRKGQERLRVLMGGRGGSGGPRGPQRGGGAPQMSRGTWGLVALGAIALWGWTSYYQLTTNQQSVEFLFGRAIGVKGEGPHFAPWPFVTYEVEEVTQQRVTEIGTGRAGPEDTGLMLTRDQNIVQMEYQIIWNIGNIENYLFNLADPAETVRAVAESAMRDIVARSEMAPILNRDRGAIQNELQDSVQATLDAYQSGIQVLNVNLGRADPPSEVIDSFRAVQAAQQQRETLTNEADAYSNRVLAGARGEAAQLVEQAEAYRAQAVNSAEGEAARFNSVYDEYVKAPEVTRRRMYLETMEKVLGGVDKVILDTGADNGGVVPYLPLDQLRSRSGGTNGNAAGGN